MTPEQEERLVDMILLTAEVMGNELKPGAVMLMVRDLARYDFNALCNALTRCRKESSGRLTLKAIIDIVAPDAGWLSANEAWAQALPALDEAASVVWTVEASRAWFVALPLLDAGDKVGARMAFIAAYDRNVELARNAGREPHNELSAGHDPLKRQLVVSQAQERGLLPPPPAAPALPPPDDPAVQANSQKIREGLKELAASLALSSKRREAEMELERQERQREVNRRFDEQRQAVLAQIAEHEREGNGRLRRAVNKSGHQIK